MSDTTIYSNEEELLTLMEEMQTEIETKDRTISRLTEYNPKWQEKASSLSQELTRENPKALSRDLQDYKEKWKQEKRLKSQAESRAEDALARKYAVSDKLVRTENELEQVSKKYSDCQNLCFGSLLYNIILLLLSMMHYDTFLNDLVETAHFLCDTALQIGKGSCQLGCVVASITEKMNQKVIVGILHWPILIVITAGLPILLLLLIYYAGKWIFCQYKKYAADSISLIVTLIMLTFLIFGGIWIKSVIRINLILIFLLVQGIYLVVRWYIYGYKLSRQ